MKRVNKKILKQIYWRRPKDSKKYDFGLLLVIGGSDFYSGSPALAALAAFQAGIDMVHIIAPKRAADIIASFSPNLVTLPLEGKYLTKEHLSLLLERVESAKAVAQDKTAIVVGGGMGRSQETQKAICEFLSHISVPAVIDADAIYAVAKKPEVLKEKPFLLTPHRYEFYLLTEKELKGLSLREKINIVRKEAERLGIPILLKGEPDIISDGKKVVLNTTGSPHMTVGGTGDTLAGIAGALLARGIDAYRAGMGAAFINGLAGEKAARKMGESLTATDLLREIPFILPRT